MAALAPVDMTACFEPDSPSWSLSPAKKYSDEDRSESLSSFHKRLRANECVMAYGKCTQHRGALENGLNTERAGNGCEPK